MLNPQLKTDFHKLIDNFQDEKILQAVYEILAGYMNDAQKVEILDDLSPEQKARLQQSIQQNQEDRVIPHEIQKKNIEKWFTK